MSARAVYHDLVNFLHPILTLSESLLDRQSQDPDPTQALQLIRAAALRSLALVQRLHPAQGTTAPRLELQDLNDVLRELEPTLTHGLPEGLALTLDLEANLPKLTMDRLQIQRMVFNLVKNAREALQGPGRILVRSLFRQLSSAEAEDLGVTPGTFICLEVLDDGPGVAPGNLPHLFTPHFTTKGFGLGHGLGLSGVAAMARAHQGGVRCLSTPPHGARFQVFLPLEPPIH